MHAGLTRRVTILIVSLLVVATAACTSGAGSASSSSSFPERTATAGAIDVKARPVTIDSTGAGFEVSFDSHAASFDADPTKAITLDVNGTRWPAQSWDGDPPAGHHRKGTIRFNASGPAAGSATLNIGDLPQPVQFTWTVGGT